MKVELIKDCIIDFENELVYRNNQEYKLESLEWRILKYLSSEDKINKFIPTEEIINYVWHGRDDITDSNFNVRISRINKVIDGAILSHKGKRMLKSKEGKSYETKLAEDITKVNSNIRNILVKIKSGLDNKLILGLVIGFLIGILFTTEVVEVVVNLTCTDILQLIQEQYGN